MSNCLEVGLKKICRSCLKTCDAPINIFTSSEVLNDKSIHECLSELCGIWISADDNLPESLCEKCLKFLVNSYQFRCEVRRNDCFLHKIIEGEEIEVDNPATNDSNNPIKKESLTSSVELIEARNLPRIYDTYIVEHEIINILPIADQSAIEDNDTEITEEADKLKCNLCDKLFYHAKNLRVHEKRHFQEGQHECKFCKKRFYTLFNLNRHIKMHDVPRLFDCNLCNKNYGTKLDLNRHMSMLHYNKVFYECKICQKSLANKTNLKYHEDSVHKKIRNHECSICKKRFATMAKVRRHQNCFSCLPESIKNS